MPEAPRPFRLGAIVLAAGGSSRMGEPKQLLRLNGTSLVVRAADAALDCGADPVAVVLGSGAAQVAAEIAGRPVLAVHNPEWATGLASSVRAGVAALLVAEPGLDAVLVAPCDQPALSADALRRLAALHRATGKMAAARYAGRNGGPAVFGRRHFVALKALAGDEGARRLLNAAPDDTATLDLPELAADLDTPSDYAAWVGRPPGQSGKHL